MLKKNQCFLFILVMLGFIIPSNAQTFTDRICAADSVHQRMYKNDPLYKKRRDDIEKHVKKYNERRGNNASALPNRPSINTPRRRNISSSPTANRTIMSTSSLTATQIVTIPVVVHVLYNNASDSISMAQIQAQIDTLNKDFRKLNADIATIPLVFKDLAADVQIQFCLAQRDPNDNPTTGVIYKYTTRSNFISNDSVKFNVGGGDSAWDCNRYLNFWVCDLMGSMAYSSFPGSACERDGIVIHNAVFGSGGITRQPYNKGRTATHEVGHWLNLYHIWGDDNNTCTRSDSVSDTPNQDGPNYGCSTFPVASGCGSLNGDLFMNYMDYGNDACIVMFTNGQKERIDATFACGGPRWAILNSTACTGIPYDTVSSTSVTNICPTNATINWTANPLALSYVVEYKTAASSTWNDTSVATPTLPLIGLNPATTYQYRITSQYSNGNSKATSIYSFTTKNTCVVPGSFVASATSHISGQATWSALPNATSYNVSYRVQGASSWITTNTTSTSITFSGLTPNTTYESQIQAVCECESSTYSTINTFKTPIPPCAVPTINTPVTTSCNSANLSWNSVDYLVNYQYQYKPIASPTWISGTTTSNSVSLNGLFPATNYEFQVRTNCSGPSSSAWSSSTNFTTTTLTCSDSYEPNNKTSDAKILAVNGCYTGVLDRASDKDYFKITTTASQPKLKITLSNLPLNYNITLLNSSGAIITSSTNTLTTNEVIINNATAGATYLIYIFSAATTANSGCYHLSISTSSTNW